MKWQGRRGSRNIEDRRRSGGGGRTGKIGGLGLVLVLVIGYFLGIDVSPLIGGAGNGTISSGSGEVKIFRQQVGETYNPPTLVLFKGATQSACGGASAASGPFYCPPEMKAFLDTEFFTTLERRMGAGGDFAAAYVVAHEIAHHVQNQLGILGQANRVRAQSSTAESNAISVRIELQADCFSGIWARAVQQKFNSLERGDLDEAMNAARQIGDDTLQRNAGQRVNPHTFTHGTSEQRQRWFARGYQSGQMADCDTFSATRL